MNELFADDELRKPKPLDHDEVISPYEEPHERMLAPSLLVDVLRRVVRNWRNARYPGVTPTTGKLLQYWFYEDHGSGFRYYFGQQEAVETIIYIHEVLRARRLQQLVNKLSVEYPIIENFPVNPDRDLYPRWAIKMATGTGKTKVMSLLTVWSILNSIRHPETGLAPHILVIAPNIIVFERLWNDFKDNKIFFEDPTLPPEYLKYWAVQVTRQDEPLPPSGPTITVTNIQRLYPPKEEKPFKTPVRVLTGEQPPKSVLEKEASLFERFQQYDRLLVMNDEGHHVHGGYSLQKQVDVSEISDLTDEELDEAIKGRFKKKVIVWLKTILDLNGGPGDGRVVMQLDFSATPKSSKGQLFQHTVSDFPLRDAMRARIVKWPVKIKVEQAKEYDSDDHTVRFKDYLEAALRRLQVHEELHNKAGKQPILFVMAEETKYANQIADWLREKLGNDKVLVIHTKDDGGLPRDEKELGELRRVAHSIDEREDYRAIVSVLMLREGWDVKNVCIIVGLRAYSAPANILPEQTIGRGLRLMYPREVTKGENVEVIGTHRFMEFVDDLHKENVELETLTEEEATRRMGQTIAVEPERVNEYDIELPVFTSSIDLDLGNLELLAEEMEAPSEPFTPPKSIDDEEFKRIMIGFYAGTEHQVAFVDEFITNLETSLSSVVNHHARLLVRDIGIGGALSVVADQLERYIKQKAFESWPDDPGEEKRFIYRCMQSDFKEFIFAEAKKKISKLIHRPAEAEHMLGLVRLSNMEAFIWHGGIYQARKSVLSRVPYDSELEMDFMAFLDDAEDVERWGRILRYIFYLEYLDHEGRTRHYVPDFVVKTTNGNYYLVETKGLEGPDVPLKDARAKRWVESVNKLGLGKWDYLKVQQAFWGRHYFNTFADLLKSLRLP